ncbi:O-antigen ligase family protein [Pseudomonas sp. 3A(2025)]
MLYAVGKKFFFLFFAVVMVVTVCSMDFSGHDQQRLAQLIIGCSSLAILVFFAIKKPLISVFEVRTKFLIFLIILGGVISSLNAHQPAWALVELSVFLLCGGIALSLTQQRLHYGAKLDGLLICFVVFICGLKAFQFFSSTVAAFMTSASVIDTDLLLDGFSNKRFYGQFQTFTLPLLVLPLLYPNRWSSKALLFGLLSSWWLIAVTGGTRGTWLGMGASLLIALSLGRAGRYWAAWQLAAAAVGVLLFVGLFSAMPVWLGMSVDNFAGDRLSTSLSAREILWQQAWNMIKEHPLLGFGPMHFADTWNAVGAHPHQAILQWASEWGVPSTLIVMGLALHGLVATWRLLRKRALSNEPVDLLRLCLATSLVGAMTQAMVDGVIVMPYSQLWLALVVGWLLALHEWREPLCSTNSLSNGLWLACLTLASGMLFYTVIRDFPQTERREQQFAQEFGGRYLPRFWMQGIIALPDRAAGQVSPVR